MNEKLNVLLKSYNGLELSEKEKEVLKHDLAMEMILSPFISFTRDENEYKEILGPEENIALFSSKKLAYDYLKENAEKEYEERIINLEFFMDLSENGLDFEIEINPGTNMAYHLGTEELIYLDEIYNTEEFKDYWKSDATKFLKESIKVEKNQSFVDCYDERLKLLADELLDRIEDVDSNDDIKEILRKSLLKTSENYENYSKIFDDELLKEIANLKIFVPVYNDELTVDDEHNGIIDVADHEDGFSVAHIDILGETYMMGFTDIDKLTHLDHVFLPQVDAKNKNYYVQLKPFTFVIDFMLTQNVDGLVLNLECNDYFLIEKKTVIENLNKLVRCDDLKLIDCSDLALNHLYL